MKNFTRGLFPILFTILFVSLGLLPEQGLGFIANYLFLVIWFYVIFSGFTVDRDKTMADAILTAIKDNEPMLTITGMAHLSGIEKRLKTAGFEEVGI